jgi:hypothetical protein
MAEGVARCGSQTSLSGRYLVGVVELNKEGGEVIHSNHRTDPPPHNQAQGNPIQPQGQ